MQRGRVALVIGELIGELMVEVAEQDNELKFSKR